MLASPLPDTSPPAPVSIIDEPTAARFLGIGHSTLKKLRYDGDGPPYVRLSVRRIGYRLADLHAWTESRSSKAA